MTWGATSDSVQASSPPQEEVRAQAAVCTTGGSFSAEASEGRRPQPDGQPRDIFYAGLSQGDPSLPSELSFPQIATRLSSAVSCDCYNSLSRWNLSVFQYEVLLCVQDQDDPAIEVCKKLLAKYPGVDARLFIGEMVVCFGSRINLVSLVDLLPLGHLLACAAICLQGAKKLELTPRSTT